MKVSTVVLSLAACGLALPLSAAAQSGGLPAQYYNSPVTVGFLNELCSKFVAQFAVKKVPVTFVNFQGHTITPEITLVALEAACVSNLHRFSVSILRPAEGGATPKPEIRFNFVFKASDPATGIYKLVSETSNCVEAVQRSALDYFTARGTTMTDPFKLTLIDNARHQSCPAYTAAAFNNAIATINTFK